MSLRVNIARAITLLILGVFIFFGFYILRAAMNEQKTPIKESDGFYGQQQFAPAPVHQKAPLEPDIIPVVNQAPAEAVAQIQVPLEVPVVTGQTEEDLRAPEPLQESPPTTLYEPPEATDPMNRTTHMSATFGSNLRHPEQMIEKRPRRSMRNTVDSGVASEQSFNFGRNETQYSEEMIQNGGIMRDGLMANDVATSGMVGGLAFSML